MVSLLSLTPLQRGRFRRPTNGAGAKTSVPFGFVIRVQHGDSQIAGQESTKHHRFTPSTAIESKVGMVLVRGIACCGRFAARSRTRRHVVFVMTDCGSHAQDSHPHFPPRLGFHFSQSTTRQLLCRKYVAWSRRGQLAAIEITWENLATYATHGGLFLGDRNRTFSCDFSVVGEVGLEPTKA
jgi:hypothetical protein